MAAGNQSKTARASMRAASGSGGGFYASADIDRIIPLGGGTYAYVLTADGRTVRAAVGSETYNTEVLALLEGVSADRVRSRIAALAEQFPASTWMPATEATEDTEPAAAE